MTLGPATPATPPGARARAAPRRCRSTVVLGVGWDSLMAAPLMTHLAKLTSAPPVGPAVPSQPPTPCASDRAKPGLAAHRTPRRNARQRTDAGPRPRGLTETAGKPGRTESVICRPRPLNITRHRADARRLGARARLPGTRSPRHNAGVPQNDVSTTAPP